jgi:hypothetical protein
MGQQVVCMKTNSSRVNAGVFSVSSRQKFRKGFVNRCAVGLGKRRPDATMPNRSSALFALLLLSTALGGCAQTTLVGTNSPQHGGALAWDGAGEDPNLSPQNFAARPRPVSSARQASEASAADQDAELAQNLVICRGCIAKPEPPAQDTAAVVARR